MLARGKKKRERAYDKADILVCSLGRKMEKRSYFKIISTEIKCHIR